VYFLAGVGLVIGGAIAWYSHGGSGVGIIITGILVLFVNWCWHLYRVIRGLMNWNERRPMVLHDRHGRA